MPKKSNPLHQFYEQEGLDLPSIEEIRSTRMPQPYKNLLVHDHDMTSTLSRFYQQPIRLRVLKSHLANQIFSREVVLVLYRNKKCVEFGAIRIYLKRFPPKARKLIFQAELPLGAILRKFALPYISQPKAFIRVMPDTLINKALELKKIQKLYGRLNTLLDSSGKTLAEIVEILTPNKKTKSLP